MPPPVELPLRPLSGETRLENQRVYLLPPATPEAADWTPVWEQKLQELGAHPVRVEASSPPSLRELDGPALVWGNLADNPAVKELYFAFLSATDCHYPGPGGYELRTLLNPFGSGHNVLHLGYSDTAGLQQGGKRLQELLAAETPRLSEIKATALPIPDFHVRQIREATLPELDWMITANSYLTHKAYLGYLTGDAELLAESQEIWRRICDYGVPPKDHNVKDLHLRMSMLISLYRLLETVGMVDEALRPRILQFFLTWVYSDQGLQHLDVPENTAPRVQRQNHGTIPGLALAYLGSYLRDFYPDREEPEQWQGLIDRIFAPYADGSWKPASEGLCHGWWLEQPILLEYALLDPEHKYFELGGARRAADCAVAVVNNLGWLPSSGDVNLLRAFPGPSLRVAAAWYQDPRYTYVHQLAPAYRSMRMHQFLLRTFDVGGGGAVPETGLTVVPLDPLVHEAASSNRHDVAPWMFETAPTAPVEQCFDKVAFRTGWRPEDAFLLIDGIGGGSHAYADALDLIEYSRLGHSFLVSETGTQYPETDSHAVVTIACDGLCEAIPCFAEHEDSSWDAAKQRGYARLVLRGNNGGTWTRELFFLGEQGLVIHDHVEAERAGEFCIQCNLRIPGKVEQVEGRVISRRGDDDEEQVIFALQPIVPAGAQTMVLEENVETSNRNPIGVTDPPREDDQVEAWRERYQTPDRVISIVRSRVQAQLQAGEAVSFLHYAHARRPGDADLGLEVRTDGELALTGGTEIAPLHPVRPVALAGWMDATVRLEQSVAESVQTLPAKLPGRVKKLVSLADDHLAVVGKDGHVVICDPAGEPQHSFTVPGPVHDASADAEQLYLGHGEASLSAYGWRDGQARWRQEIERIPSSCAWWEWYTPAALAVVAAPASAGFDGVVVGCGDLHVRHYSPEGEYRWEFRYMNGIPAQIGLADLNGNGVDEIVLGGEVLSNCAHCRVLDASGTLLQDLEVEGWTSRMTAQTFASGGEGQWAAFGVTRGRNLNFYAVEPQGSDLLVLRWLRRLPGTTTDIHIDPGRQRVLAGSSLGLLLAFDFEGEPVGRLAFSAGISRILSCADVSLIGLEDGTAAWVQWDAAGALQLLGASAVQGDWMAALRSGEGLLVPTGETLSLLQAPEAAR